MIVRIGQEVVGTDGRLGILHGLRIDPKSQAAEQMVIRHGFPVHDHRLAVLGFVTRVEDGTAHVNLSQDQLDALELYNPDAYRSDESRAKGSTPSGGPGVDRWTYGTNQPLSEPVQSDRDRAPESAAPDNPPNTPVNETHPMTPRYPVGEDVAPEEHRPTVIAQGTPVWDSAGDKVGSVHVFGVETTTGEAKELKLQRGFLSQPDLEIPMEWVHRYGPEGVMLRVSKEQVQELVKGTS